VSRLLKILGIDCGATMPRKKKSTGQCNLCHNIRTVIQIREILELEEGEDVVAAIRNLKEKVARERSISA
jgi:hypothetical protein